jgi:hypothetical protein
VWQKAVVWTLLIGVAGCASAPPPAPDGWRTRLGDAPPPPRANAFPLPPEQLEKLMGDDGIEILGLEPTPSGIAGAMKMEASYPTLERPLFFKWKPAPRGGDGWNNTPRREIAAYRVQQWFLDPQDYVVPTPRAVCIPFEAFPDDVSEQQSFDGTECVFGVQTVWLVDVASPDRLYEPSRFYRDPNYARHLAHYNLLTYLIENRDTRAANYLVFDDESNRRVYSVDNGISFGVWLYNFFVSHWNEIRVPALPLEAIERLRAVTPEDLEALAVVEQLRRDHDGMLREDDASPAFDADSGVRVRGDVIQLGLRRSEIDEVGERLRELLNAVGEGEIPVF